MGIFGQFFQKKPKKFLGIDIGTCSIRIVEMERKGSEVALVNYGEAINVLSEKHTFKVHSNDLSLFEDRKIIENIREICSVAKILTKDANFSIPDFCSLFINLELPVMAKEEIVQAINYEVRPYIPLPLSEITLDWIISKGEPSKTPLKIIVIAIPIDIVFRYQEIANQTGLNLKVLEPEVFALSRASMTDEEDKKKTIGLIDFGARSTTCSILEKGLLQASHSFNTGGNEFTGFLARSLNMSYNEAEEVKKVKGMIKGERSRGVLLPLVDSILEEIKKVFRDYYKKEGKEVEKIILFGSTSLLPGLREYLSEEIGKEIVFANPFKKISYPQVLNQILEKRRMLLTIPMGLALRELQNENSNKALKK